MRLQHKDKDGRGEIHFLSGELQIKDAFENPKSQFLTIALNIGESQKIIIDGVSYDFPSWSIIPLVAHQVFSFENTETINFWRYNREFYCMADSHVEISCIGLIFLGYSKNLFLELREDDRIKISTLSQLFVEEFESEDYIKTDMLLALLKRFVIILTRLAKQQHFKDEALTDDKFDFIRQFNFHVEGNFRKEHKVQFYADLMNKSPKTLSNIFSLYNYNSPMSIIHDRVISEAKRLLFYSDKSAKEIAFELGFDDAAHFSRFFKNATNQNTSSFRKSVVMEE
ncbi:helix-turn-helix domain-containing protein [Flavobacterium sp. ANB]|uniref:AraC family transcriptional regulator n=1 Tax=unclassified Flavobacterium TaxID=196869 RepID=UPI0012B872F1|nr:MULTISPECIES: helix-turn-helix domain-containing protein [unclassified Flavobacterium]MBF4519015.1 helix-turn-helix domain-containing protein [Flavobacterium sp. ANB]MTD71617.1 helix-turn-helix domain-containing protein [Flavobacterium sp. LC2016-13]